MNNKDIGYFIKTINDKLKARADADLKNRDLTLAQSRVLGYLEDCGGKTTQKEIERYLEVSHPTVVGIISRMEQKGYLICWMDPQDKRNKIVSLTEKAARIGKEMKQHILQNEAQMLRSLSEEQVHQLVEMLSVIHRNLNEN